jgi:hypothetical protein
MQAKQSIPQKPLQSSQNAQQPVTYSGSQLPVSPYTTYNRQARSSLRTPDGESDPFTSVYPLPVPDLERNFSLSSVSSESSLPSSTAWNSRASSISRDDTASISSSRHPPVSVSEQFLKPEVLSSIDQPRAEIVKWGIPWKTPALMAGFLCSGIAFAVEHHAYYMSLHGTPAGTKAQQQWATAFGTAFSFLAFFVDWIENILDTQDLHRIIYSLQLWIQTANENLTCIMANASFDVHFEFVGGTKTKAQYNVKDSQVFQIPFEPGNRMDDYWHSWIRSYKAVFDSMSTLLSGNISLSIYNDVESVTSHPWIPSKSMDWSIIHRFKSLNYYRNFFWLFQPPFFSILLYFRIPFRS